MNQQIRLDQFEEGFKKCANADDIKDLTQKEWDYIFRHWNSNLVMASTISQFINDMKYNLNDDNKALNQFKIYFFDNLYPITINEIRDGHDKIIKLKVVNGNRNNQPQRRQGFSRVNVIHINSDKYSIIPKYFGKDGLKQLTHLDLENSNNPIIGYIPPSIGDLHSLIELNLSNNMLDGLIPKELKNLKHLEVLLLHNNELKGRTNEIDLNSNLKRLTLYDNDFSDYDFEREQLKLILPNCNIDFGSGHGNKFDVHLVIIMPLDDSGDFITHVQYNYSNAFQIYSGFSNGCSTSDMYAVLYDLKIDDDINGGNDYGNTTKPEILNECGPVEYNRSLEIAEHYKQKLMLNENVRPFIVVKHDTNIGPIIYRFLSEHSANKKYDEIESNFPFFKAQALYDVRANKQTEKRYKGNHVTGNGYSIENDFKLWMRNNCYSSTLNKVIGMKEFFKNREAFKVLST